MDITENKKWLYNHNVPILEMEILILQGIIVDTKQGMYSKYNSHAAKLFIDYINKCIGRVKTDIECITQLINCVKKENYRQILTYKHIQGLSFEEIADKIHYSTPHTQRIYKQALAEIAIPK